MMCFCIDFIKNNLNENNITLSAQEYIKDLYLSCGFAPISDIYDEVGIPHIKMRLQ
jgi:ElaA protein